MTGSLVVTPPRGPEVHRTSPMELLRAHAWQLLGAVAGVALFVGRGWSRVERPGIWAEDGTHFLPDALAHGLGSLFIPFQGYVHVIPRIVALFLSPFPLATQPRLYTLAAIFISLLAFAPVLSKRIDWLIPSPVARAGAFVLLCALPALSEVYGNLANLIFVCGVGSVLIGLSADPVGRLGRALEIAIVLILGLSGPLLVLLSPLFVLRLLRERSRHSLYVLGAAALGCAIQLYILLTSHRTTPNIGTVYDFGRTVLERWIGGWLAGDSNWPHDWASQPVRQALVTSAVLLVVVVLALVELRPAIVPLASVLMILLGVAAYAFGPMMYTPGANDRHLVVPHAVLVLILVAGLSRAVQAVVHTQVFARRRVGGRQSSGAGAAHAVIALAAAGCLLAGMRGMYGDFDLPSYNQPDMSALQRCLETTSRPCMVPSAPRGWRIIVRQ
jgi:hypothetical protein